MRGGREIYQDNSYSGFSNLPFTEMEKPGKEQVGAGSKNQGSLFVHVEFKIPVRFPRQANIQIRSLEEYFATRYRFRKYQHINGIKVLGIDKVSQK